MDLTVIKTKIENSNIETIINGLRNFAKGDIEKSLDKDMLIATFILCVCFIDQVSGYYCGINHMNGENPIVGKRFKQFCKDYLHDKIDSRYDSETLYGELRNEIVHSYSSTGVYALGKGLKDFHLTKTTDGCVILSADVFFEHVNLAFEKWVSDLNSSDQLKQNSLKWFDLHKTFEQIPLILSKDKKDSKHNVMLE